jgi:Sec-independent protein secretion pathway component TatC
MLSDLFDLRHWRVWILGGCILAIVLTPNDPFSMLAAAALLCVLYVTGAWLGHHHPRRHSHQFAARFLHHHKSQG